MGLDWHATWAMAQKEQEDDVRRYYAEDLSSGKTLDDLIQEKAPRYGSPCAHVGAPRMRDLPDFKERMRRHLEERWEQVKEEQNRDTEHRNQRFFDHWNNMTLDQLMAENEFKFCCEACPLLRDLQGADSQDSFFLGVTVSSCDFRGKRISADPELGDLADEAFAEHDPEEMLDYAGRLERRIPFLRRQGYLDKDPYQTYSQHYRNDPFARVFGEPLLSKADYDRTLHWREQNIRDAVHWLRTCARHGVRMGTSY